MDFDPLLNRLSEFEGVVVDCAVRDAYQVVHAQGEVRAEVIAEIADRFIPELRDIVLRAPIWRANWNGLIQLFVCYYIFEKLKIKKYAQ